VVFAWRDRAEHEISAQQVAKVDREGRRVRTEALAGRRPPS
jgi:hypothetical protein